MKEYEILFVDDDKVILDMADRYLSREGYTVSLADSGLKAMELLKEKNFDIVFTDFKMPEISGIELLSAIKEYRPETEVIIVTGHGTMESAIQAMKIGSYDYLQKPFKLELLKLIIERIIEEKKLKDENVWLKTRIKERHKYDGLVGISLRMQEIYEIIDRMKSHSPNVFIQGESGTGKELTAQVIHQNSDRKDKPLASITCRTFLNQIPEGGLGEHLTQLLKASGGSTFYLDEIADIAPIVQTELVRALKRNKSGSNGEASSADNDIRIIAATNRDLKESIEHDKVRREFLNCVNTVSIKLPPLRERKEDICLLINHFLNKYHSTSAKKVYNLAPEALDYLLAYHWPGNVIQLENVFERAFALGVEAIIEVSDLPAEIRTYGEISNLG
jgi:DNA-binding NtrC family response regulator